MSTPSEADLNHCYFQENMSHEQIAEKFQISRPYVSILMKKYKIKTTHKKIKNPLGKEYSGSIILNVSRINNQTILYNCQCKSCDAIYEISLYKLLRRISNKCQHCRFIPKGPISIHWWNRHVVDGAKSRKIAVEISIDYAYELFLEQEQKCAYSGIILTFPKSMSLEDRMTGTASLDRIDNTQGYTKDNIQWVHKDVNIMKRTMPHNIFISWCTIISNNLKLGSKIDS